MKDKLILTLLKKRNQNLLQILVISIFILVFKHNDMIFCLDNEQVNSNNVEILCAAELNPNEVELLRVAAIDKGLNKTGRWADLTFLIDQLNQTTDPRELTSIRIAIHLYAKVFNVDLEPYLFPIKEH